MTDRGRNDLLQECYRNLGRAAFVNDLIITALIVGALVLFWRFA